MKKHLLILPLLLLACCAKAQVKDTIAQAKTDTVTYVSVDTPGTYPGGIEKFLTFLAKNLRYPNQDDIEGKVYMQFVIEKDGTLSGIKVAKGLAPKTDAEAIRVLTASGKWIPGYAQGKAVRSQYTIPILFRRNN